MSFTYGNKDMIIFNNNYLPSAEIFCVDSDIKTESDLGVKQSINTINNTLVHIDKERFRFTLNFLRKDRYSKELKAIDEIFLNRVNMIFFNSEDVGDLQIGRYFHYYVIPVEGTLTRYDKCNSMFSITFESLSSYKYSVPVMNYFRVENSKRADEVTNQGLSYCYADLIVNCLSDGKLTIINKRNNKEIIITNCKCGEKFRIDTENCEFLNIDFNRVNGDIRETLKLNHGDNEFEIIASGIFEVWTEHQAFYALF